MTPRDRIRTVLEGGTPDQVPYHDAFWATTIERWRREGLPRGTTPEDHFGCEMVRVGGDYTLQLPVRVLEETGRYRVYWDSNGALRRDMKTSDGWTPCWLDFQIKDRESWRRLKGRAAFDPSRIPAGIVDQCAVARAAGRFLVFSAHACFHPTWHKIGMENMLVLMHEDPDLIQDMFEAHTSLIAGLYDAMRALGIAFDGAWLSDDLGYRNAPLISPAMYRDMVFPHHRRLCSRFAQDGLRTILHSDGNVEPLIGHFLDAGFDALHPLEVKAGLDVHTLRKRYGRRLCLFGNIDVRALAGTREEIEAEVRNKVGFGREHGGYVFHSDHSVPNNVSLENYRFAMEILRRYGSNG